MEVAEKDTLQIIVQPPSTTVESEEVHQTETPKPTRKQGAVGIELAIGVAVPTIWRLHSATWRLCKFCGKRGHLAAVCRSKSKKPHYPASQICQDVEPDHQATVLTIPNSRTLPIEPRLKLVDEDVIMEVDTAASVSLMPVEQWRSLQLPNPMEPTKCVTYLHG